MKLYTLLTVGGKGQRRLLYFLTHAALLGEPWEKIQASDYPSLYCSFGQTLEWKIRCLDDTSSQTQPAPMSRVFVLRQLSGSREDTSKLYYDIRTVHLWIGIQIFKLQVA